MANSVEASPVLRMDFAHDYYNAGAAVPLTLVPTAQCEAVLQRHGLRFEANTGHGVIWKMAPGGAATLKALPEGTLLSFRLLSEDPYFLTVSSFASGDLDPMRERLYITTLDAGLVDGESVVAADKVRILPVLGHTSRHHMDSPARGEKLTLHSRRGPDGDGPAVWRGEAPQGDFRALMLDFQDIENGRYILELDGRELLDFYLSDVPASRFLGVLEVATTRSMASGAERPPEVFVLRFKARDVRLRYIVQTDDDLLSMAGARITAGAGAVLFGAPVRTTVGGLEAWEFTSNDDIPLSATPEPGEAYWLNIPKEPPRAPDRVRLPHASSASMSVEGEGAARKYWRTMHVML